MPVLVTICRAVALVLEASVIAACSSDRPFKSEGPANLHLATDVRSVSAQLDVYAAENKCSTEYQGTVELPQGKTAVSLPLNKQSRLVFVFSGDTFTTHHSASYDLYVTPRPGYRYDAEVSYADGMYSVTIYEQSAGGSRHKIPHLNFGC